MKTEKIITIFIVLLGLFCAPDPGDAARSSERRDTSDDRKGYTVTESDPVRILPPSSGNTGGTFGRTYTFTVTDYEIEQADSFEIVRIPGAEYGFAHIMPILPYFRAELNMPEDASVVSLRVTDGSSRPLGQLSIPGPDGGSPSGYTDELTVTGLFPPQVCEYHMTSYLGNHSRLSIFLNPVRHNVDTKETTLWAEATVEVQYEVGEAVFISDFRAGRESYRTTEDITASVTLGNVGDTDLSGLTAVLSLKNYFSEILLSTDQPLPALPAGEATVTEVRMSNGAMTDDYILVLEITDSQGNVIASAEDRGIWVTSEDVAGISFPEGPHGVRSEIPFTVTFENFNLCPLEGILIVKIYDEDSDIVLTFVELREFPAESVTEVIVTGDMGDLTPGHYEAEAVFVFAAEDGEGVERYCRPVPFTISPQGDLNGDLAVDMADFILAMKILVSENIDAATLGSTDPDGKIGLDDVLRILREIAEDMPVSP